MASAVIHLCVAKKVNDYLNEDIKMISLGSIAPDISKLIGQTKEISHFLDSQNEDTPPNVDKFLAKYRNELNKPFELGYLIHLLTDKYWFADYIPRYIERYEKDNKKTGLSYTGLKNLIYNDYTNLNIELINKYNPEIDMFMNEIDYPRSLINEIPIHGLPIVVEKMGKIIMDSKEEKTIFFNIRDIDEFIEDCSNKIIEDLKDIRGE